MTESYPELASIETQEKIINAIGRLKRAIGVPSHPILRDSIGEICLGIYTTDKDSAAILSALFHQFLHGQKPVFTLDEKGCEVENLPANKVNGFSTGQAIHLEVSEKDAPKFLKRLDKYVELHLTPDRQRRFDESWLSTKEQGKAAKEELRKQKAREESPQR